MLEIDVPVHLGRLLMVKLRKHRGLLDSDWFCKWVTVQGPGTQGEVLFPCYSWLQCNETICLPEGTGEGSGGAAEGSRRSLGVL